jgi:hypothetical protein
MQKKILINRYLLSRFNGQLNKPNDQGRSILKIENSKDSMDKLNDQSRYLPTSDEAYRD